MMPPLSLFRKTLTYFTDVEKDSDPVSHEDLDRIKALCVELEHDIKTTFSSSFCLLKNTPLYHRLPDRNTIQNNLELFTPFYQKVSEGWAFYEKILEWWWKDRPHDHPPKNSQDKKKKSRATDPTLYECVQVARNVLTCLSSVPSGNYQDYGNGEDPPSLSSLYFFCLGHAYLQSYLEDTSQK
jgi:hypothetical protein